MQDAVHGKHADPHKDQEHAGHAVLHNGPLQYAHKESVQRGENQDRVEGVLVGAGPEQRLPLVIFPGRLSGLPGQQTNNHHNGKC